MASSLADENTSASFRRENYTGSFALAFVGTRILRLSDNLIRWLGFTLGARVRSGEYSFLKLTSIILRTWHLMQAKAHPRWNWETWELQIYFTSRTLSGNKSPFAFDTGSRPLLPTGPCIAIAKFISPAALCQGTRVSSLLAPETAHSCQLAVASPSPDLFHQPHFVWEQESLRF